MTLVERLILTLTDEQRNQFLQLIAANPKVSPLTLYHELVDLSE